MSTSLTRSSFFCPAFFCHPFSMPPTLDQVRMMMNSLRHRHSLPPLPHCASAALAGAEPSPETPNLRILTILAACNSANFDGCGDERKCS
jgi:hypothetical protein